MTLGPSDAVAEQAILYYALKLYFTNGGGPCYIVPINSSGSKNAYINGIEAVAKIDEVTLLVFPDAAVSLNDYPADPPSKDYYAVCNAALTQCGDLKDRFAILDVFDSDNNPLIASNFRNGVVGENLKYGAAYMPFLRTSINYLYDEDGVEGKLINFFAKSISKKIRGVDQGIKISFVGKVDSTPKVTIAGKANATDPVVFGTVNAYNLRPRKKQKLMRHIMRKIAGLISLLVLNYPYFLLNSS